MTITIGNQKGGAGKSTLALLLANFLSMDKMLQVTLIDMDYQQSIAQKFDKSKVLENAEPYQVISASLESYPVLKQVITKNNHDIVLIDLPGKLDDDNLEAVFMSADLSICPFAYEEFSFESTVLFALMMRKLNPAAQLIFIPNRIKANAKYEIMQEVNRQLSRLGIITDPFPDRVDFQRTTTFQTPSSLMPLISPVFGKIYTDHIYGKHEIAGRSAEGRTG